MLAEPLKERMSRRSLGHGKSQVWLGPICRSNPISKTTAFTLSWWRAVLALILSAERLVVQRYARHSRAGCTTVNANFSKETCDRLENVHQIQVQAETGNGFFYIPAVTASSSSSLERSRSRPLSTSTQPPTRAGKQNFEAEWQYAPKGRRRFGPLTPHTIVHASISADRSDGTAGHVGNAKS